jgi:pyridoxal phosphate enzyme (YggS family)
MDGERLRNNYRSQLERLHEAERAAGREEGSVTFLPVTKSVSPATALALAAAGAGALAENRAPALEEKAAAAGPDSGIEWHFIGSIQRNKARRILQHARVLHSVDSLRLLETLERIAGEEDLTAEAYLEVRVGREEQKHGFLPEELATALESALGLSRRIRLRGIMVMGPLDRSRTREVFEEARDLAQQLPQRAPGLFLEDRCRLSMGMSGDLELAVACGTDLVRVGSALFEGVEEEAA